MRVVTAVGVVGYGHGGGGQPAVHVINDHLSRFLVERSIDEVGDIAAAWDELYRVRSRTGAAAWADGAERGGSGAVGRAGPRRALPVHRLIGRRNKQLVTAYATGSDLELTARYGYTAMKLSHRWQGEADYDSATEWLAAPRGALGPAARLMVDCYCTGAPDSFG